MLEFYFVFPSLLRKDRENVSTVKHPSENLSQGYKCSGEDGVREARLSSPGHGVQSKTVHERGAGEVETVVGL